MFTIYIDTLLQQLSVIAPGTFFVYADDIKFVTGVTDNDYKLAQEVINCVGAWSSSHAMPLSVDKCTVLHCGAANPNLHYDLHNLQMPSTTQFKDLGVTRSQLKPYKDHVSLVAADGYRLSGAILRAFRSRNRSLLWMAFQTYIRPKVMYASSAWSPTFKQEVDAIESVQRRFTKKLPGLQNLTYDQRLTSLGALSLKDSRTVADMILIFKCMNGLCGDITLNDLGLCMSQNNERSGRARLNNNFSFNRSAGQMFKFRTPTSWNCLSASVTSVKSVKLFKAKLTSFYSHNVS